MPRMGIPTLPQAQENLPFCGNPHAPGLTSWDLTLSTSMGSLPALPALMVGPSPTLALVQGFSPLEEKGKVACLEAGALKEHEGTPGAHGPSDISQG